MPLFDFRPLICHFAFAALTFSPCFSCCLIFRQLLFIAAICCHAISVMIHYAMMLSLTPFSFSLILMPLFSELFFQLMLTHIIALFSSIISFSYFISYAIIFSLPLPLSFSPFSFSSLSFSFHISYFWLSSLRFDHRLIFRSLLMMSAYCHAFLS